MNKIILALTVALIGAVSIYYIFFSGSGEPRVVIGSTTFEVELAVTADERALGLGERQSLEPGKGMLFIFDKPGNYGFWMKGMKMPLDIIYILNEKVVAIYENVAPPSARDPRLITYGDDVLSDKVLEINAGEVSKYGIKKGDTVKYHIKTKLK